MQNTYQNKITDIQSKKPPIFNKLEGGKKFKIESNFKPAGDQPTAIRQLVINTKKGETYEKIFLYINFTSIIKILVTNK